MYVWDLNPVAVQIGPFAIHWYGIVYAIGFLVAWWMLRQAADKQLIPNLDRKSAEDYIFLLVMGSIIMARLFYVFVYNPGYYFRHLSEVIAVWQGGLSIHGGLVGAVLVTYYWCKKHNIRFYHIADLLVVPLALFLGLGRITNFVNGELWGTVTNVPWCVEFPRAEGCRHPSQLYEAAYSFVLFGVLLWMQARKRLREGLLFWTFIGLYGLFRFLTTFFREPDPTDPVLLGLAIGQWLSLAMVGIAGYVIHTNK